MSSSRPNVVAAAARKYPGGRSKCVFEAEALSHHLGVKVATLLA